METNISMSEMIFIPYRSVSQQAHNVETMSIRHDVESTLFQRCEPAEMVLIFELRHNISYKIAYGPSLTSYHYENIPI